MKNVLLVSLLVLTGCGVNHAAFDTQANNLPAIDVPQADLSVIHGLAVVTISNESCSAIYKFFENLFSPKAYAGSVQGSGTTTVTYTNSASTQFTISVTALAPAFTPTFTGNTLNLGTVSIATLSDNNISVCSPGTTTKCSTATIGVYTTGTIGGFVNTVGAYGAPVFTGTLNPTTPVGLLVANMVPVQTYTILSTDHKLTLASDFPSANYTVTSDFVNAGTGSYTMTYVVEYALTP